MYKNNKFLCTKCAYNVIKYSQGMRIQWNICVLLGLIFGIFISLNHNTISIVSYMTEIFNTISIAFIAMIIGAYAIFQALLNDDLVYEMHYYNNGDSSLLTETNHEFLGLLILYLTSIITNILILLTLKILPSNFLLFKSYNLNITISTILVFIYIAFHLRIFVEIRNFAVNLYRIFEAHNLISILKKENQDDNKNI